MSLSATRHLSPVTSLREHTRLPLWFPVLLGCGIALYFMQDGPTPLWPYVTAVMAASVIFLRGWNHAWIRFPAAAIVALMVGASASALRMHIVDAPILRETIFFKTVEGTVDDIQHKEKKTKLFLRDAAVEGLDRAHTPKRLSVTVKQLPHEVEIGARVRLPAMLFPPPSPVMPGAYDFARMFYFQQLGAVGFSPRSPEIVESAASQGGITALRLAISDRLVAEMGPEMGAIASALMVGEQSRVPEEVNDSMRASGIYHILSISGLHMSLATGLIFFVVRLLLAMVPHAALRWPNKKIAAMFGLLGGAAYLLLAGSPVPAVRSYIMVACVLGAVLADRKGISMFSLGWAATLILLLMPESLFTASFQLSFAATLAIVGLYERYGYVFFHAHAGLAQRIFLYFLGLMITSLAATFYTSPLAITHFNRMAIYGILANMLVVPLSSFWIMPFAMLSFLAMPLGLESWPLLGLKMGLEWMMAMSRFVSHFPYANIPLPAPNAVGFVLIIFGGLWFALWVTKLRFLGLAMIAGGLATIALFVPYDLIVSDDARRIAYRSISGQWVMLRGDVDSFEAEIWLRTQGEEVMLSRKQALAVIPELRCDKSTCQIMRGGKTVVVAIRKDPAVNLCASGAELVVTSQFLHCDVIPHVVDRAFVERHGAAAVRWQEEVMTIDTAQERRGAWPWAKL